MGRKHDVGARRAERRSSIRARLLGGAAVAALCAAPAAAQSFNLDIAPDGAGPPSTYAAAGGAGHWHALPAVHNTTTFPLIDVTGAVTGVDVWQFGGTELLELDDPDVSGDDATMMNDALITYSSGLETCLFFHNLEPGTYEVLVYARMPGSSTVLSYSNCDEEPGNPHVIVGGAWPGRHVEGVTYARHVANVTSGLLRVHSGIVPGEPSALGAAFNGVQIRLLDDADLNQDGDVDGADLGLLLGAWGAAGGAADLNLDGVVDGADLGQLLAAWSG